MFQMMIRNFDFMALNYASVAQHTLDSPPLFYKKVVFFYKPVLAHKREKYVSKVRRNIGLIEGLYAVLQKVKALLEERESLKDNGDDLKRHTIHTHTCRINIIYTNIHTRRMHARSCNFSSYSHAQHFNAFTPQAWGCAERTQVTNVDVHNDEDDQNCKSWWMKTTNRRRHRNFNDVNQSTDGSLEIHWWEIISIIISSTVDLM